MTAATRSRAKLRSIVAFEAISPRIFSSSAVSFLFWPSSLASIATTDVVATAESAEFRLHRVKLGLSDKRGVVTADRLTDRHARLLAIGVDGTMRLELAEQGAGVQDLERVRPVEILHPCESVRFGVQLLRNLI